MNARAPYLCFCLIPGRRTMTDCRQSVIYVALYQLRMWLMNDEYQGALCHEQSGGLHDQALRKLQLQAALI